MLVIEYQPFGWFETVARKDCELYLIAGLVFFLVATPSFGQFTRVGPSLMATGGAGIAAISPLESPYVNPATLTHARSTSVGAFYRDGVWAKNSHETTFSGAVTDASSDVLFPASARYSRERIGFRDFPTIDSERIELSVAQFVFNGFSLGARGVRLKQQPDGEDQVTQYDFSLGVLWVPTSSIGVGLVYNDLTNPGSEIPSHLRLPRAFELGGQYVFSQFFKLRLDIGRVEESNPGNKFRFRSGMESKPNQFLAFRVGYQKDHWDKQEWWTAGFGFDGPNLKVNYAVAKNTVGAGGALHTIDLQLNF